MHVHITGWSVRRWLCLTGLAKVVVACLGFATWAQGPPGFTASSVTGTALVEEDWELVVDDGQPVANAPQVTCTMSTTHNLEGVYAVLEINHRSSPSYAAGGMQIQTWQGETPLDHKVLENSDQMDTPGEVVRWTMYLKDGGNRLIFGVKNGSSSTWGAFGDASLRVDGGEIRDLDHYCPDCSIANSSVGFSSNRVQKLVLKEVRWYDKHGKLLKKESSPRVVYQK